MHTTVVLFTRDLRVRDHPALAAAARDGTVIPLFVLDEHLLDPRRSSPNRIVYLLQALHDLRATLRTLGTDLVVRHGDPVAEAARLAQASAADRVFTSKDVSPYARRREAALGRALAGERIELTLHPGVTVVPPDQPRTTTGTHYSRFTPFAQRWSVAPRRPLLAPPTRIRGLTGLEPGVIPSPSSLSTGPVSPGLPTGGEGAAQQRLRRFLDDGLASYDSERDLLALAGTAGIGADLHFGCLSPLAVERAAEGVEHGRAFARQVCWRDFHHHTALAHPLLHAADLRPPRREWRVDEGELAAWKTGRTGVPLVDAAMRQLVQEGLIHGRGRMVAASFLTKSLQHDWREGLAHFDRWLVDGDYANNAANWQWMAGTGTDTRPNRILNPVRQAERFDPEGAYVRRYVPELRELDARAIRRPWLLGAQALARLGYPPPLIEHDSATSRFRQLLPTSARSLKALRAELAPQDLPGG